MDGLGRQTVQRPLGPLPADGVKAQDNAHQGGQKRQKRREGRQIAAAGGKQRPVEEIQLLRGVADGGQGRVETRHSGNGQQRKEQEKPVAVELIGQLLAEQRMETAAAGRPFTLCAGEVRASCQWEGHGTHLPFQSSCDRSHPDRRCAGTIAGCHSCPPRRWPAASH